MQNAEEMDDEIFLKLFKDEATVRKTQINGGLEGQRTQSMEKGITNTGLHSSQCDFLKQYWELVVSNTTNEFQLIYEPLLVARF